MSQAWLTFSCAHSCTRSAPMPWMHDVKCFQLFPPSFRLLHDVRALNQDFFFTSSKLSQVSLCTSWKMFNISSNPFFSVVHLSFPSKKRTLQHLWVTCCVWCTYGRSDCFCHQTVGIWLLTHTFDLRALINSSREESCFHWVLKWEETAVGFKLKLGNSCGYGVRNQLYFCIFVVEVS